MNQNTSTYLLHGLTIFLIVIVLLFLVLSKPAAAQTERQIGVFAGAVTLDRSVPGNADQGGDAFLAGLRLGALTGVGQSRFRIGAEAEAWAGDLQSSSGALRHRFNADGGAGAYARLAWEAPSGARPFARVGMSALLPENKWQPHVGFGLEAPLTQRLSARADIGLTQGDRQVWTGTAGLVWRW